MLDASTQSRSELGVATWGVDVRDDGVGHPATTVVHGYDGAHTRMFEYDQSNQGMGIFLAALDMDGTKATLALRADDQATFDVVENSFKENDKARRVLERIAADLNTQMPQSGTSTTAADIASASSPSLYVAGGQRVEDQGGLVGQNGGPLLTSSCSVLLAPSAGQGAKTADQCVTITPGLPCQTQQQAKDTSAQCASDGTPLCPTDSGFVETSKTVVDTNIPTVPSGVVICTRIDRTDSNQRGDVVGNPQCNSTQAPISYTATTSTTSMVSKKITIQTTDSSTEAEATSVEAQAGAQLEAVSLSLKASKTWSNENTTSVANAVENWKQYSITNSDTVAFSIPPGQLGRRYVTNDIVYYTQISYIRQNGTWQKGEGSGHVKVPMQIVNETVAVASCTNVASPP